MKRLKEFIEIDGYEAACGPSISSTDTDFKGKNLEQVIFDDVRRSDFKGAVLGATRLGQADFCRGLFTVGPTWPHGYVVYFVDHGDLPDGSMKLWVQYNCASGYVDQIGAEITTWIQPFVALAEAQLKLQREKEFKW